MIDYIIAANPDNRIIAKASQILKSGRLICLPLDTSWVVLADRTLKISAERLYRFHPVQDTQHFTIYCTDFAQANEIAMIDDATFRYLRRTIPGPYTFILPTQKKVLRHFKDSKIDTQIGIRFPCSRLLERLLTEHGEAVVGTAVTAEMIPDHPAERPIWSGLLEETFGEQIALILDAGETHFTEISTVISFRDGSPEIIS